MRTSKGKDEDDGRKESWLASEEKLGLDVWDQVVMPGTVILCCELGRETSAWGMRGLGDRSVCKRRKRVA